jgi:uncharacterized membrane protein (UPF0127 family)
VSREPVPVRNLTRGSEVAARVRRADRAWSRMVGLLGRRSLAEDEGLLLTPCTSIHTFFMLFPIDILYLDREHAVVKAVKDLRPFRFSACLRGAHSILELPAGTIDASGTQVGDRLTLVPNGSERASGGER